MTEMTTVDARANFSELVNRSAFGKERIVLNRRGKKIVAVIPVEDLKLLESIEDAIDVKDAMKSLKEARKKGTISFDELKKELNL